MTEPKVLERDGCAIHYWLEGPDGAPVVVLMHGAAMDHGMFTPQVEALRDRYRVLTWDARGQGRSQPVNRDVMMTDYVADLVAILDAEGIERAVVGGQSLGGYVSQYTYLHHPERVRALVVIGSTSIALPLSLLDRIGLGTGLVALKLWPWRSLVKATAKATAVRPEVQAYARQAMGQLDKQGFLRVWAGVHRAIPRGGLPEHRIEVPFLFVYGESDRVGAIKRDAPRWRAHEPDMVFHEIPEAGHNANQDNPTVTNEVLGEFLDGLPAD